MATTLAALTTDLAAAGLSITDTDALPHGGVRAYITWHGPDTMTTARRVVEGSARDLDWHVAQLTADRGTVTLLPAHAARILFELEGAVGTPVTVHVPEALHYSRNLTGRVLGLGRTAGRAEWQLLLESECDITLVPVEWIERWEPQT